MPRKVSQNLLTVSVIIAFILTGILYPASADDTEIYQAVYDADSTEGSRPKVLIVFDDSGSMSTLVEQQPPDYDPASEYAQSVEADRIYWSDDASVPELGSSQWFEKTQNRCASSYDDLINIGSSTVSGARRWIDSTTQNGQCTLQCPDGTEYRNPPGPNNAGCYEQVTTSIPVSKLVYSRNDWSNNRCYGGLFYVDPPGNNNDACYEEVTSTEAITGWVYRSNDNNDSCGGGTTYLTVDPPGSGRRNRYDACFEEVTEPEYTVLSDWEYSGEREEVCDETTVVPGSWQSLESGDHSPSHVECENDVTDGVVNNGPLQGNGYPQHDAVTGNEYGPGTDPMVQWGDSRTFYTSHYINWANDESLNESRSRLDIAQEVISTIIERNGGIDFGLLEFNYDEGGRIAHRIIQNMTPVQRTNLIGLVNQMDHAGSTPMCEAMYEAYNYIAGRPVEYGNSDRAGSDSRGTFDVLPKDLLAESGGSYVSPNTDCAYTYVILVTDGFPQRDTGANARIKDIIDLPAGQDCDKYEDANGNDTENCLPELTQYMANHDLAPNADGDQFAITYTIGFATDQELLRKAAENGGGSYETADDAQALTNAFQGAIVGILSKETTFTSPAVAVDTFTRTRSSDEVFYAMFQPAPTVDWIGNIKKLRLNANKVLVDAGADGVEPAAALNAETGEIKDTATTFWSPAEDGKAVDKGGVGGRLALRDPADRTIYSNTGAGGDLEPFNTTNFDAEALGLASNAAFYSVLEASTQTAANEQIDWARGFDAYDKDGDEDTNESRGWILGDILHSQPLVLNYGAGPGFTETEPDLRFLVGSNSGFVHLFGNADGEEDWAFFPKELASILPQRRRNEFSTDHVYGMDLTPVSYIHDSNRDGTLDAADGDKAWVFLGMRRGGHAYYALDLSNPDSPTFMWRIDNSTPGFGELGQTWSEPLVIKIPGYVDENGASKPVLVFGAGYDTGKDEPGFGSPDQEGRGLYIVDAQTGALVWSVTPAIDSDTNLSEPGLLHSVPGGISVLDSNADKIVDRIYFGDTGGNLWRVDLSANELPTSSQDTWQINQLAALSGDSTLTDRRIFNAPDLVRVRLGGEAADVVIIGTGDRTNPNATDVDNRLYRINDLATAVFSAVRPTLSECEDVVDVRCGWPITEETLFDISNNKIITGTVDEKNDAIEALREADGWFYNLNNAGEKSLASAITIDGSTYLPTFAPASLLNDINSCMPESGTGRMYIFDIYNGDRIELPMGDIIPDTPSPYISEDGTIFLLMPPGAPAANDGIIESKGGVLKTGASMPPPYGNYWFQENYE